MARIFNAAKLKELRGSLKQIEIGNVVGMTDAAISNLETGKTKNPTPATVNKLADHFNVEPESFWVQKPPTQRKPTKPKKPAAINARIVEAPVPMGPVVNTVELRTLVVVDTFKDGSLFVRDSQGSRYYRATQIN